MLRRVGVDNGDDRKSVSAITSALAPDAPGASTTRDSCGAGLLHGFNRLGAAS